jgi:hypothetical protein
MNRSEESRSYTNICIPGLVDDRACSGSSEGAEANESIVRERKRALGMLPKGVREAYGRLQTANQHLAKGVRDNDLKAVAVALEQGADPNMVVRMASLVKVKDLAAHFADAPLLLAGAVHWGGRAGELINLFQKAGADFSVGASSEGGFALEIRRPTPMDQIGKPAIEAAITPIDNKTFNLIAAQAPGAVASQTLKGNVGVGVGAAADDEAGADLVRMMALDDEVGAFLLREREQARGRDTGGGLRGAKI